jgi:hypothetical protein
VVFAVVTPCGPVGTLKPHLTKATRSSIAVRSVNPRWMKLILCGINRDEGTLPRKAKESED